MRELSQFSEPELRKELSRRRKLRKEVKRKSHGEPKRRKGRGCGLDRDEALKKARGYTDPSTFVRSDGTEVLKGADWRGRIYVLFTVRAKGQCEYEIAPGIRCGNACTDPCHVTPRHPKRNDELGNLKAGCRSCHDKHDEQGWRRTRFGEQQKSVGG